MPPQAMRTSWQDSILFPIRRETRRKKRTGGGENLQQLRRRWLWSKRASWDQPDKDDDDALIAGQYQYPFLRDSSCQRMPFSYPHDRPLALLHVTSLHLAHCHLSDEAVMELANHCIRHAPHCRHLNLAYNHIGPSGLYALAQAVLYGATCSGIDNGGVHHLDLSGNREILHSPNGEGWGDLIHILIRQESSPVKVLRLDDLELGPRDVVRLVQEGLLLPQGTTTSRRCRLESLSLAYNAMGDEGGMALAKFLKVQDQTGSLMTHLNVSNNRMGKAGMSALLDSLSTNARLQRLSMGGGAARHFGISWDLLEKVKRILQDSNTTLTYLDIVPSGLHSDNNFFYPAHWETTRNGTVFQRDEQREKVVNAIQYFLLLNSYGRKALFQENFSSSLLPLVLEKVGFPENMKGMDFERQVTTRHGSKCSCWSESVLYGLLRQVPHFLQP